MKNKGPLRLVALLSLFAVLVVACGEDARVGDEKLLEEVDVQEGAEALGRAGKPSPDPEADGDKVALGKESPSPSPSPSPEPEKFFEIWLVADFPYYFDGTNQQSGDTFIVPSGFRIRIVNKDNTTDSGGNKRLRQPAAADGSFIAPVMNFEDTYELPPLGPGTYNLRDEQVKFITNGKIEVR